jgi:hypothetical protein
MAYVTHALHAASAGGMHYYYCLAWVKKDTTSRAGSTACGPVA